MSELVTTRQAHDAIAGYLTVVYEPYEDMSEDMELMILQINNMTCWDEWERCVKVRFGKSSTVAWSHGYRDGFTPRESFDLMRDFIKLHHDVVPCDDYRRILEDSHYDAVDELGALVSY